MMKRTIQFVIALLFTAVIACGIQVKLALADVPCIVSSNQPCVLRIESNNLPYEVEIDPKKQLLIVYTNQDFKKDAQFKFKEGKIILDEFNLSPNVSVFQTYTLNKNNDLSLAASDLIKIQFVVSNVNMNAVINSVVVVMQADGMVML